jgi:hypothetical protein
MQVAHDGAATIRRWVKSGPVQDDDGTHWTAGIETETFSDGGPHHFGIHWTEVEELHATSVEFQGLVLTPSYYSEAAADEGALSIMLEATLTPTETQALRDLQIAHSRGGSLYWPVVRRGVSDEPRDMRLGRVLWSLRDTGEIDHQITLVDEAIDRGTPPTTALVMAGEPQISHLATTVAGIVKGYETLLETLTQTGVLDQLALQRIRSAEADARTERLYRFYEVDDISRWR